MESSVNISVVFLTVVGLAIALVAKFVYDLPVLKLVGIVSLSFCAHLVNRWMHKQKYK